MKDSGPSCMAAVVVLYKLVQQSFSYVVIEITKGIVGNAQRKQQ